MQRDSGRGSPDFSRLWFDQEQVPNNKRPCAMHSITELYALKGLNPANRESMWKKNKTTQRCIEMDVSA